MADKVINGSLDVTGEISQNGTTLEPGTKWYRHRITVGDANGGPVVLDAISTYPTPLTTFSQFRGMLWWHYLPMSETPHTNEHILLYVPVGVYVAPYSTEDEQGNRKDYIRYYGPTDSELQLIELNSSDFRSDLVTAL